MGEQGLVLFGVICRRSAWLELASSVDSPPEGDEAGGVGSSFGKLR